MEGPVILPARPAVLQDRAGLDGEVLRGAIQPGGCGGERNRASLGADQAQGCAADFDRERAGGHALVRCEVGAASSEVDLVEADIKFLRGDLGEGGGDALTDFDLADADAGTAGDAEIEPAIQARIVGEAFGERVGDHRNAAAAWATAARMRGWAPQRQRLPSSASAISVRLGEDLHASKAAAAICMPDRQ